MVAAPKGLDLEPREPPPSPDALRADRLARMGTVGRYRRPPHRRYILIAIVGSVALLGIVIIGWL
jgi:hypothetical protein